MIRVRSAPRRLPCGLVRPVVACIRRSAGAAAVHAGGAPGVGRWTVSAHGAVAGVRDGSIAFGALVDEPGDDGDLFDGGKPIDRAAPSGAYAVSPEEFAARMQNGVARSRPEARSWD